MAITLDTTSTSIVTSFSTNASPTTWSHTTSGSDRLLVLTASIFQDVAGTGTITSASYNGTALTKVTNNRQGTKASEMWYLIAPATGSNTVSVTISGSTVAVKMSVTTYTGALQSGVLDVSNTATGTSGDPTVSVTTTTDNDLVVATLCRHTTTAATSNRTSIFNDASVSILGAASNQITTTAGAYSDTYTGSVSANWSMIIASFKPAAEATSSIALDSTSSSSGTGATTLSWSHTCSGSNRILIVGVQVFDDTNDTERTVASVTYAGVAMTRIDRQVTGNIAAEIWRLVAPSTGTNTILVTLGAANDFSTAEASSWTGVDQTSPINATNKATGGSLEATVSVTTTVDNCIVVDSVCKYNTIETLSVGTSQTSIASLSVGSGFGIKGASSYETKATAGATTMNWTWTTTARDWAIVATALTPAGSTDIARDAVSSTTGASVTSLTWSHTVAGTNRILLVATQVFDDTSEVERTVSSVTYNGDALTRIDRKDNGNVAAELWYRVAPDVGTANVVVTLGAANDFAIAGATSFTGVDQTYPINISETASGGLTEASNLLITTTDGCVVVDSTVKYATNETLTTDAGQTSNYNTVRGSGFGIAGASSYEAKETAGTVTTSYTWTVNDRDWAMVHAAITPAGAVTFTRTQVRFVFRNDNGTEVTASNIAAFNTNITRAKATNTRIRFSIASTGDAPSSQYRLEYRKVGDTTWTAV